MMHYAHTTSTSVLQQHLFQFLQKSQRVRAVTNTGWNKIGIYAVYAACLNGSCAAKSPCAWPSYALSCSC